MRATRQIRVCPTCGARTGPCQKLLKAAGYYVDLKVDHKDRPK